jgi:hypothetical protein
MGSETFKATALALLLLGGHAVLFGQSDPIGHAQAQQSSSPSSGVAPSGPAPTPPTQSPVTNPSTPNTVTQPSYAPSTPSRSSTTPSQSSSTPSGSSATPSAPSGQATSVENEKPASTNARPERRTPAARSRSVHHHYRGRSTSLTYACSHLGCVRTYAWAFPCQYYSRYCAPLYDYAAPAVVAAPARWWPGYYDYAPGQFGRARYLGRGHRAGYWGD